MIRDDYIKKLLDLIEKHYGWTPEEEDMEEIELEHLKTLYHNIESGNEIEFEFQVQEPVLAYERTPDIATQSFLECKDPQPITPIWTGGFKIGDDEFNINQ